MTPKLKALSLIESMSFSKSRQMNYANGEMVDIPQNLHAKQCALIAVDMVIENLSYDPSTGGKSNEFYWLDVKKELQKL